MRKEQSYKKKNKHLEFPKKPIDELNISKNGSPMKDLSSFSMQSIIQSYDVKLDAFEQQIGNVKGELQKIADQMKCFDKKINHFERNSQRNQTDQPKKAKKKNRKKASEIDRKFTCSDEQCQKGYGNRSSLNTHKRIKHSQSQKSSEKLMRPKKEEQIFESDSLSENKEKREKHKKIPQEEEFRLNPIVFMSHLSNQTPKKNPEDEKMKGEEDEIEGIPQKEMMKVGDQMQDENEGSNDQFDL